MTSRPTMGPPASEPEQRDYAITITAPDGTTTSAGIVRSHHALDAAREAAEARSFAGPFREWVGADGRWSIADRDGHTVVAIVDTPHAQASVFAAARRAIADTRANDERAAVQKRIADAIRDVPEGIAQELAELLCSRELSDREKPYTFFVLAALAAAARDDRIADAVAQVRQAVVLERGR